MPDRADHTLDAPRRALLDIALESIAAKLRGLAPRNLELSAVSPILRQPGASFVTLQRDGRLLGCIGTIEPCRPLALDVAENAIGAAFHDPRLPPVDEADYRALVVKISILSPMEPLTVADRAELASAIRPETDGLLITCSRGRATFLPSVWDQLPHPTDFLDALWQKAGMPPTAWPGDLAVQRYTTDEFADPGPRSLDA